MLIMFDHKPAAPKASDRLLVIDDSAFFRNLLTPLLSVAGYEVVAVDGPEQALALQDDGADFDVVISDIEMPGMDGFAFARTVRAEGRWMRMPLVALSSHATERDCERGREAGFDDDIARFDRGALLATLHTLIGAQALKGVA